MTSGQTAGQGLPHRRLIIGQIREENRVVKVVGEGVSAGVVCRLPDELQLQKLLVSLEDWSLGEEFSQNTTESRQIKHRKTT